MADARALERPRITSIAFRRYKAFQEFSITLQDFNVLVGPNNSGKSTIIGALRILGEGIRRARARSPEPLEERGRPAWGHRIDLKGLPIAAENVFFNYDDSEPAEIRFRVSNGNFLRLHFPEQRSCYLLFETQKPIRSPSDFKREFDVEIAFVPILGPVEHNEPLYQKEAARLALLSHNASRNFRNIWYHYREGFAEFCELIKQTWPGMDIQFPEPQIEEKGAVLRMFCPEERFPREIYWAGYGFQVWAQMLTYIVQGKQASLLVIDEPDIYLHSDLQRQLVSLLQELGPDVLIATHSTEIVSEVDPHCLLSVNKKQKSAKQVKDASQVKRVFAALGSNINPILTQLAKTRRALFVEGGDFQILALMSRILRFGKVANRAEFAVVPVEGFNPKRALDLARGIELTLDAEILKAVILDRDYRSSEEVKEVLAELRKIADLAWIHSCKEIENFLLNPTVLQRAIAARIAERHKRFGGEMKSAPDVAKLLDEITLPMKPAVAGQYLAKRSDFLRKRNPGFDLAASNAEVMMSFEKDWAALESRLSIVSGKQVLAELNQKLQKWVGISVSNTQICGHFKKDEIPQDLQVLLRRIKDFSEKSPSK
jgi:energy-coupling factor transporter ATP-binding protein EcfA2